MLFRYYRLQVREKCHVCGEKFSMSILRQHIESHDQGPSSVAIQPTSKAQCKYTGPVIDLFPQARK